MNGPRRSDPVTDSELVATVGSGATRLGLALDTTQVARLVAYVRLIERWNATYNLTAIRDPREMATHHIVDSLTIVPTVRRVLADASERRLLDVGSGAGLPGVVVAICDPATVVVCVDAVGKKAAFVTQVAATLGLPNLSSVHARVEAIRPPPLYSAIVSRAFASLADFVTCTKHLIAPGGRWIGMKGQTPTEELAEVEARSGVQFAVEPLDVPGVTGARCLALGRKLEESEP